MEEATTGPLTRVDLNKQAYATLRQWLMTRVLGPGEKLNIRELAERLGVSRSPVVYAVTRLVADGLVSAEPRRGYYVKPLTEREVRDAHDFRMLLELYAAERGVGNVSADQLRTLRTLLDGTLEVVEGDEITDRDAYIRANQEFHEHIVALSDNPFVVDSYRRLSVHTMMVRTLAEPRGGPMIASRSVSAHREVVDAYERGDVDAAKAALRTDIENGARLAMEVLAAEGGVL
jgi:4-nitrophenol 2-monooxygenase / 4-nitrocatechol 4-monooxygenase, reductase component